MGREKESPEKRKKAFKRKKKRVDTDRRRRRQHLSYLGTNFENEENPYRGRRGGGNGISTTFPGKEIKRTDQPADEGQGEKLRRETSARKKGGKKKPS